MHRAEPVRSPPLRVPEALRSHRCGSCLVLRRHGQSSRPGLGGSADLGFPVFSRGLELSVQKADLNGDSIVTREEIKRFGQQTAHRNVHRLLMHFDAAGTNHGGLVTEAEIDVYGFPRFS